MRPKVFALHVVNILVPAAGLFLAEGFALKFICAGLLFFALFTLMHDAIHGALGLPRKWNEAVLAVAGAAIGVSGHATRHFHMRHHAEPFSDGDLEGQGFDLPLWRALAEGVFAYPSLPVLGWKLLPARFRPIQLIEWMAVLGLISLASVSQSLAIYVGVLLLAQLTIPVWAARIPHHPPTWLVAALRPFIWTHIPAVIGLIFHDHHHNHPRIPTYALQGETAETATAVMA